MDMMNLFITGIGLILAGGIISMPLPERVKSRVVALFTGCGAALVVYVSATALFARDPLSSKYVLSYPAGTVTLVIDKLSAFFAMIISVMSFIGTVYAIGYMRPYYGKKNATTSHFFFLAVLIASMLAVTVVQNVVAFIVVWEVMSLSSFFLVAFENEQEEVYRASINYLIAMHVGLFLSAVFSRPHMNPGVSISHLSRQFSRGTGTLPTWFLCSFSLGSAPRPVSFRSTPGSQRRTPQRRVIYQASCRE